MTHTLAPAEQVAAAIGRAPRTIFSLPRTPQQTFEVLARACADFGVEDWDLYDEGGAIGLLENQVRDLLGTEDAAFFPSGIMAQQAALRVHTDRSGSKRVALPDRSHLLVHEEDGPRLLHGFRFEPLTTGNQIATRARLDAIPGRLGAVLVEIPLRDAGCMLPTWDELVDFSAACRERGVPLHFDGARLWESQAWFDRPLAEIADLADTMYVSFYKGLGGLAGSVLAGSHDAVEEARLWRRRMGGTIYRSTAEALSSLVGLRDLLGQIPATVRFAAELAAALPDSIRTQPAQPQTNQFLLYAEGTPDDINRRLLAAMESGGLAFSRPWRDSPVPGVAMTELAIGAGSALVQPEDVAALFAQIIADVPANPAAAD